MVYKNLILYLMHVEMPVKFDSQKGRTKFLVCLNYITKSNTLAHK